MSCTGACCVHSQSWLLVTRVGLTAGCCKLQSTCWVCCPPGMARKAIGEHGSAAPPLLAISWQLRTAYKLPRHRPSPQTSVYSGQQAPQALCSLPR